MAKRSRKHRVVLDITINKPVAERTAVAFMREVLRYVDWNAREYIVDLYCDRAEAKSYIHVTEGLQSQGEQVAHVYVTEGPTYEDVVAENTRLRAALADAIRRPMGVIPASAEGLLSVADLDAAEHREPRDPASIYDEQTIDF
jgi:hypothetical protein